MNRNSFERHAGRVAGTNGLVALDLLPAGPTAADPTGRASATAPSPLVRVDPLVQRPQHRASASPDASPRRATLRRPRTRRRDNRQDRIPRPRRDVLGAVPSGRRTREICRLAHDALADRTGNGSAFHCRALPTDFRVNNRDYGSESPGNRVRRVEVVVYAGAPARRGPRSTSVFKRHRHSSTNTEGRVSS